MGHVNIFKTKSKEELVKLYGEFLKVEETGFLILRQIWVESEKFTAVILEQNTTWMLQIELTHAISDFVVRRK